MAQVAVKGLSELVASLKGLRKAMRGRILRPAMAKAGRIVKAAVKAAEPFARFRAETTSKVSSKKDNVAAIVSVSAFAAHWIDLGVRPHALGKGSSLRRKKQHGRGHPGFKGVHFMQKAWDASKDQAADVAMEAVRAGIEKELGK